jgi:hypothetical protein
MLAHLLWVVIVLSGLQACSPTEANKLVGEWKGADGVGRPLALNFTRERELWLVQGGDVLNGQWMTVGRGRPLKVNLYIDVSPSYTKTIPAIGRFTDEGDLQLRVSDELKYRPTVFEDHAVPNQYTLSRKRS